MFDLFFFFFIPLEPKIFIAIKVLVFFEGMHFAFYAAALD